jgi:hypothetical protein
MSRTPFLLLVRRRDGADERRIIPSRRSLLGGSLAELSRLAELLDETWLAEELPLRVERRDDAGVLIVLWEHQGMRDDN